MERVDEHCICSAIKIERHEGEMVCVGKRHNNIIADLYHEVKNWRTRYVQGFLTNEGRFVDRVEGLALQIDAGIPSKRGRYYHELYSEDLY